MPFLTIAKNQLVIADQLYRSFDNNPYKAKEEFKKNLPEITGTINRIISFNDNDDYAGIEMMGRMRNGTPDKFVVAGVRSDDPYLTLINKGDWVVLDCLDVKSTPYGVGLRYCIIKKAGSYNKASAGYGVTTYKLNNHK